MHLLPHGREYGKGILSSRIHVMDGKFNKRSKEAHRRAFKSGKKKVVQKEAGGRKKTTHGGRKARLAFPKKHIFLKGRKNSQK